MSNMSNETNPQKENKINENELAEIMAAFKEIQNANESLTITMQKKDLEIQSLKSQLEMKESQIETISGIIKTKDDQIESLKETLKMKDEQIFSLKQTLESKQNEIETLKQNQVMIDDSVIKEKDEQIKKLEEEIKILNVDLKMSDEEIEQLNKEIEELKARSASEPIAGGNICQSNIVSEDILNFMIEIIGRSIHNVNITTPTIMDLAELQLYDLKASVNIKASCSIDISNEEHQEILQEMQALENVTLRSFTGKDRWVCLRDGEELLIAVIGENENNLAIYTKDPLHIKFFNAIVMESWLRAQKI
ncbi:MAG: hypothetical protein ACTSRZ_09330 [Promethearchaeota archaeon]